jgi:predicted DNA-binding protein
MTPRIKQLQSLYLEPEKAELLDALAAKTRIPKAVLLREAVDDLLAKFKALKAPRRK